jgi:hypothetical protein
MASPEIRGLFLFPSYQLVVFNCRWTTTRFRISGSYLVYGQGTNLNSVATEYQSQKLDSRTQMILGRMDEITEEKARKMFKDARYNESLYPNYSNPDGPKLESAKESLKSLLVGEDWPYPDEYTWIIKPRPTKKMSGKKVMVKFSLIGEDMDDRKDMEMLLPVYHTEIKEDTSEVTYSIEIPDHIYDFLMEIPELEERPKNKVYSTTSFSDLKRYLNDLSNQVCRIIHIDKEMAKAEKVIIVKFVSSYADVRDPYNHGYAGNKTKITYQFFVAYKMETGSLVEKIAYFSDKRWEPGKGYVCVKGKFQKLTSELQGGTIIPWTQEREDYLILLEQNFQKLSDNLNKFMGDINTEKLDILIKHTEANKLLTG